MMKVFFANTFEVVSQSTLPALPLSLFTKLRPGSAQVLIAQDPKPIGLHLGKLCWVQISTKVGPAIIQ